MKISQMVVQDRPREKLERYGADRLKDAELLAILLGTGVKGISVIELSGKILNKWKEKGLGTATVEDLIQTHGLGKAKASEIVACFELGRRLLNNKQTSILLEPKDIWERMIDLRESKKEYLAVFYLDSRNQEIKREIVSVGTLNETLVHPREIYEQAITNHAASIIISHNHPSGDPKPSQADIDMTKKLVNAGKLLDIALLDHVIVTKSSWESILESKAS